MPTPSGATIEFNGSDINYHRALFKNMLKPLDDTGLQFWWIDWQQGPFTAVPFLNPTVREGEGERGVWRCQLYIRMLGVLSTLD